MLSLGGAFSTGDTPFRNLADARRVPLFLAVGRDTAQYGSEAVCQDCAVALRGHVDHPAAVPVRLRVVPQMLTDVDRWIIEQITSPAYQQTESVVD